MNPDMLQGARPMPRYTAEELKTIRLKNMLQRIRTAQSDCERVAVELEREGFKDNSASLSCAIANLKMAAAKLVKEI